MPVLVGTARRPLPGELVCGDAFAVVQHPHATLVCLADGLGHGPAAREASEAACQHARDHAEAPLGALIRGMDGVLATTRGAAVSLLSLQPGVRRVQFVGIGNVEVRAIARSPIAPPTTPGIVGHGLRSVRVWEYPLADGDLLVLMTDGISSRFELGDLAHLEPQRMAEVILARHQKSHDDACCVVAQVAAGGRALGATPGGGE